MRFVPGPDDFDLTAEQGVLDPVHTEDTAPVEHDRVFDLRVDELAPGSDRRVRTDVGVCDVRIRGNRSMRFKTKEGRSSKRMLGYRRTLVKVN